MLRITSLLFSILLEGNHGLVITIIDNGESNRLLHHLHNGIIVLRTDQAFAVMNDFLGPRLHLFLCNESTDIGRVSTPREVHIGGSDATSILVHDHIHFPVLEYRSNGIGGS